MQQGWGVLDVELVSIAPCSDGGDRAPSDGRDGHQQSEAHWEKGWAHGSLRGRLTSFDWSRSRGPLSEGGGCRARGGDRAGAPPATFLALHPNIY